MSNDATSGVAALVPPFGCELPSTTRRYGDAFQSALALKSGMQRPTIAPGLTELIWMFYCQDGRGNTALTPPPVLPPLLALRPVPSNQTISV